MNKKAFYVVITIRNDRKLFQVALFDDTRKLKKTCDETFELHQRQTAEAAIRIVEKHPNAYWLIKFYYNEENDDWMQLLIDTSPNNPCEFYEKDAVLLSYDDSNDDLSLHINPIRIWTLARDEFQKETGTLPWDFDRKEVFAPADCLLEILKKKLEQIAGSPVMKIHYLMDRAIVEFENSEFAELIEHHDCSITYHFGDKVTQLQLQDRIYGDGKLANNTKLAERMVLENL